MKLKIVTALSASTFFLFSSINSYSAAYTVPPDNQAIIGQIEYVSPSSDDTLAKISQRYDIGFNALEKSNPTLNLTKPLRVGESIKIPKQHLLPNQKREGIVVNLPEMRMYYYVQGTNKVVTYPIGIGKIGKTLPITKANITKKVEKPNWVPPDDIREFVLSTQGIVVPQIMPAGPDNPLGPYAIYMSIPTFLIHSTIFPESIGKRASFGCIRMYESDIKDFFPAIEKGVPVVIINSPIKVAWHNDHLLMEAYPTLEEHSKSPDASLPGAVSQINALTQKQDALIDWQAVAFIETERDGLPHDIGINLPQA